MDEKLLFAEYVSDRPKSNNLFNDEAAMIDLQSLENQEAILDFCSQSSEYNIYTPGKPGDRNPQ
jgi:hypothetical protein